MQAGSGRHRKFIKFLAVRHTFDRHALYESATLGQRPRFICSAYGELAADVSNSYPIRPSCAGWSKAMFDLILLLGFALLCAYIAYERMCHRI
jgi:hypothetical protein